MAKVKVTAKKHNGDDAYSWAIFVDNQVRIGGLHKSEVNYYKRQVKEQLVAQGKEVAK